MQNPLSVSALSFLTLALAYEPSFAATVSSYFSESTNTLVAGMPAGANRDVSLELLRLNDGFDQSALMLATGSDASLIGLWRYRDSQFSPAARINATGSTGPGRSNASDVFFSMGSSPFRLFEQGGQGQTVFQAKAGDPALGASLATRGVWLNDGVSNREIARASTTGALGPGMDANTVFENSDSFVRRLIASESGRIIMHARVGTSSFDEGLLEYRGNAWQACALDNSNDPAYSPGVVGVTFDNLSTGWAYGVNRSGRIFGINRLSDARYGLWSYCQGAPQVLALEATTGALGPGLGGASVFTSLSRAPLPLGESGAVIYGTAASSNAAGAPSWTGYFHHRGQDHQRIALTNTTETGGAQIPGAVFSSFGDVAMTQGEWLVFSATISGSNGNIYGYWRWSPSTGVEPVALTRVGAYSPNASTFWSNLRDLAVSPNGEVILYATLCDRAADNLSCQINGTRNEFWRIPRSGSPTRLLGPGDTLLVPTAGGTVSATIATVSSDFNESVGGIGYDSNGRDYWINRLGILQAAVTAPGVSGTQHVRLQAFNPNVLLQDSFE